MLKVLVVAMESWEMNLTRPERSQKRRPWSAVSHSFKADKSVAFSVSIPWTVDVAVEKVSPSLIQSAIASNDSRRWVVVLPAR